MSLAEQIAAVIKAVEKQFGKGTLMSMATGAQERVKTFPSGSLGLDLALGTGGVPRGRVIEVFGPESSGKTTLSLHMIAEAQKAGLITAFIDAEHALDIRYAAKLGVNVEEMLISQPDYGEQALDIAAALAAMGGIGFIVVDSVAALTPKAEIEGEMGDHHVGLQARLMSQAMRKLTAVSAKAGTTILFINQIRNKIGVMFGSPETTTGGNALKFYSSVRIEIRRLATLKTGETATGNRVRIKVVKNKLAPPFQEAETDIVFGKGFDTTGELLDLGVRMGLLSKSGAWFSYGEERIGQGREAAAAYLEENLRTREELGTAIRQVIEPAE
ncbi:MAG: recombinase RecA [Deltaproteobacteria bacterium]|nr:recombinase RecA [Deltaproteobacteria bacterium]